MAKEKTSLVRVSTETLVRFRKACLDLGLTAKEATEWLMERFIQEMGKYAKKKDD